MIKWVIMKLTLKYIIIPFLLINILCSVAYCDNDDSENHSYTKIDQNFDKDKWRIKKGKDFPYRNGMLNDIVYTNKFRTLIKSELLDKLGEPTYYRDDKSYLYYVVTQTRLFSWPLHTKTLVIKITEDNTVEWIKIHK